MNSKIRWLVLTVLATTMTSLADVISYDMAWQTDKHENIPACNLSLYVLENGIQSSSILNEVINPSSTGLTFTATASDVGFSNFVNYITNGTNGVVYFSLKSISGLSTSLGGNLESVMFNKPGPTVFDLQGSNIVSISITVNTFILDSPGTDLWHDGTNTNITSDFTLAVTTVPEPSTLTFFGIFAGGAILIRKRKSFR